MVIEVRPGPKRHGGELFPPGDGPVGIEQLAKIGSGRRRGNADELELRGIVASNFAGIEGGMAPLTVAPDSEAAARALVWQIARRPDGIEHRTPLAFAYQISVNARGAKARIVGGGPPVRPDADWAEHHRPSRTHQFRSYEACGLG